MSKARKSSTGASQRRPKAHIPFRADDQTRGKKTGMSVGVVDRHSDGFESFGEVLGQADEHTPVRVRGRRDSMGSQSTEEGEEEFDEDGEMSMELDDPISTAIRRNETPRASRQTPRRSEANISTATSRQSNRSSYIDFDQIPSPRLSTSTRHSTARHKFSLSTTPTRLRSNLSQSLNVPSSPEDDERSDGSRDANNDMDMDDYANGTTYDDGFDEPAPETSSPAAARTSFTEMDRTDEDQPMHEDPQIPTSPILSRNVKGKRRASDEDAEEVEDEIERGLKEVNGMNESEEETAVESAPSKVKKGKKEKQVTKERKKQVKRKWVEPQLHFSDDENGSGLRRGKRLRYKPLEYWRLEHVTFGRRETGVSMVPVIKDIVRVPKEEPKKLGVKKRHTNSKPRSRSKTTQPEDDQEIVFNPEEGWDDQTDPYGVVLDFQGHDEVQRRLAYTAKMVDPKQASGGEFKFQKVFSDGEFIASGQVVLPVGGKKPSKSSKDNTYVFFLFEGAINLKIHRTSFILSQGAMFLVPRGNTYYLENISQRPAKLFFAQARKVADDDGHDGIGAGGPPGSVRTGSANPSQRADSKSARSPSVSATQTPTKKKPSKR